MALIVIEFKCVPDVVSVPGDVTFSANVRATDGQVGERRLELRLADDNPLSFIGGAKSLTRVVSPPVELSSKHFGGATFFLQLYEQRLKAERSST